MQTEGNKICARCEQLFVCNVHDISSCHCSQLKIDVKISTKLKESFDDCLCANCLRELIAVPNDVDSSGKGEIA